MQTFLPWPDFATSAKALDMRRLGKQRVETLQILKALTDENYGWQHHPATKMWRGYEVGLVNYGVAICAEWITRGYKDTCLEKIEDMRCEIVRYRYKFQGEPECLSLGIVVGIRGEVGVRAREWAAHLDK